MRLLVVEDDVELGSLLVQRLTAEGYIVDLSTDGEDGLFQATSGTHNAIILDIGLPQRDGLSVLEDLRGEGHQTPVLLLTARNGWKDKVKGLRLGADDYLAKPFETEELLARIEALIRRAHGHSASQVTIGGLEVDLSARRVRIDGAEAALTANEYRALAALVMKQGQVLSKIELAEQIWLEETDRDLNAVEVTVARLRKKLGADTIQTRRGHGYVID